MDLTLGKRRWLEIRFYYFCVDLYRIRHDMMDIIYLIDTIPRVEPYDESIVKNLSGKLFRDEHFVPIRNEVLILAILNGMSKQDAAEKFMLSRAQVHNIFNKERHLYSFLPKFTKHEDEQLYLFMEALDKFQKAGI